MSWSGGRRKNRRSNEESGEEWTTIQNPESSLPSGSKPQSFRLNDKIQLDLENANRAAQKVKKYGKKIIEKQKQSASKHLEKCKGKFEEAFKNLETSVKNISDGFESIESDKPSTEIYYRGSGSLNTPREKQLPALCEWCERKEKYIEDIRQELTKDKNLSKHNEETLNQVLASKDETEGNLRHLEQYTLLKQQCQTEVDKNRLLEVQFSILQQKLQTEKDNSLRRLIEVCASKDEVEENLRRLEKQHAVTKQQCQTEVDKSGRLEEQVAVLKQQLQNEKDTKDDALRRLSSITTKKLRDNEPNITDLSDPNRPTKIAEKLSELYDNQWTDAFEVLQKDGKQDEIIIQELLRMLMDVFYECSRLANDRFFERVQDSIEFPVQRKVRDRTVELPNKLKQHVKEFQQVRATKVLSEIQEVVLQNLRLVNQPKDIQSYLAQCVEIGWLAAVQDPPLALCGKSPDRFDTNVFKDYTQRGPYVEYVVWPALLLHENGPLLAKGVAQRCSVKPISSLQNLNPNLPAERQNSDASDGGSSTPKKAVVGPPERQTGNGAHFSKTISASGNRITRLYTGGSNPTPKDSDF